MKKVLFLLPFIIMMFGNATAQGQVSQKDFDAVVASWGQAVQPDATALQDFRKGLTSSGIPQTLAMGKYMVLDTLYFGSVKFANGKSASDTNMVVLSADLDMLKAGNAQLKGKKIPFMAITEKSNKSHLIVYFDPKKPATKQTAPSSTPALAQNSGGAQNTSTAPTTAQKAPQGTGQVGPNPVAQNQVVLSPGDIVMMGGIEHVVAKDGSFMLTANGQAQRDALYKAPPPAPVAVAPIDTTLQTATYAMSVSTTGNPKLLTQQMGGVQDTNPAYNPNADENIVKVIPTAEGNRTFYNKNSPWVPVNPPVEAKVVELKPNESYVAGNQVIIDARKTTNREIANYFDLQTQAPTRASEIDAARTNLSGVSAYSVDVVSVRGRVGRRARVTHHGSGGYGVGDPDIVWP